MIFELPHGGVLPSNAGEQAALATEGLLLEAWILTAQYSSLPTRPLKNSQSVVVQICFVECPCI